ncbi:snare associated Golgi protein-domain-containing protein, partial [Gamsiella multidivaricata]|uniref:snare associated Golgi protein-domain-containing protein n=1 Tax=Gamsiella multidivaricata TaxID=101098 RepID=UPI002220012D
MDEKKNAEQKQTRRAERTNDYPLTRFFFFTNRILWVRGPPVIMICLFATSFPPVIGYSSIVTMSGYVYGFVFGFIIAFSSALAGSIACFYLCRKRFKAHVRKLMAKNKSLKSVVRTVERRGFRLLVLIRLAPYPYNIMNALLSATHIPLHTFALATAISLIKLTLHVYIGSTLSSLTGDDDPDEPNKGHGKKVKVFVMIVGIILGIGVGAYVWMVAKREIA